MNYIRLARSYPNYLGYGMLHYFFSCMGQTFLISTFVPYFVDSLSVTNSSFSLIYGLATVSSAMILPFAGKLIDQFRLRNLSVIAGVGLSLACLLTSFSANTFILFFGLLILRFFGQGMMVLIGSTSIARYFDLSRGKALSLSSMGLPIAESFMPVVIISLIQSFGWPSTWQILAAATLIVFVPTAIMLVKSNNPFQFVPQEQDPSQQRENTDESTVQSATRREVLRDWRFYMLVPGLIFLPLFITGIFIHQNLLAEAKGWTMQWMASCFVGFGVARISTNFIAGSLIDSFSSRNVFIFYLLPIALGLGTLLLGNHPWLAMIYMILAGITASLSGLTSASLWAEIYGVRHLGAIKSMTTTLMVLASAIGPIIIGFGMERNPNATLIASIAVICLITIMSWVAIRATESSKKQVAKA